MFTGPGPFNSLLWRAVVLTEDGYLEGYYSVLDGGGPVQFTHYDSDEGLLDGIEDTWSVQRLKWFSKGFYAVNRERSDVIVSDLRMGVASSYVFRFKVGEISNPHTTPVEPVRLPPVRDMEKLGELTRRIWSRPVS